MRPSWSSWSRTLVAGPGRQDKHERDRGLDADKKIHRGIEDIRMIAVQAEHDIDGEANAPMAQGFKLPLIVLNFVLFFINGFEAVGADGFHADIDMQTAAACHKIQ